MPTNNEPLDLDAIYQALIELVEARSEFAGDMTWRSSPIPLVPPTLKQLRTTHPQSSLNGGTHARRY